ncbi:MAG: glycerophosphodiester phosphodiesterase [Gemmatimonadales bacterium]
MPIVIAHRGASAYEPENSIAAFRRAVELGADGIELDVHETADGELVVVHDPNLDGEPIAGLPVADVRTRRLPNGESIPTLAEALAVIGPDVTAFIEVKTVSTHRDTRLFAIIDAAPDRDRCHVHSFDHRIIKRLGAGRPGLVGGVLSASYPIDPVEQVTAAGAATLWQQADHVDRPLVGAIHDAGYRLYAWTVDAPERMRELAELGVDGLCTNKPDVAREVFG